MINLVRSVQKKMKGFSLGETREYYKSIMKKAWAQIEAAGTPEMKSEKYAEGIDWLMLDGDFTGRTRRTFETGPVYVPIWWGSLSPTSMGRASPAPIASTGGVPGGGKSISLPQLPGSDFAASIARGVQNSAGSLVGSVSTFTAGIARTTNPPPVTRSYSRGGSGGGGCACACACAGCACACAGGGR
jgi:hypothetical protein